ncbi:hypothetical protein HYPSUDRAFT_220752 [Hypholoma sublateritium FD-334 SS-4]|uniref:F-box domain-containing protein n=1 Tax=Hypholoma sublateritium (strain FD-334 SS-4) TaxID=945553 RepID=A0A0D2NZE8_HYPSF|nr:hypothetical protein HYPSUDRAFT_220752 [Hypholoma sublateritium FD-334 SS-4]
MEKPTKLSLDVLGYIADILGADRQHPQDRRITGWSTVDALKRLSLTCKFMFPICRRHLFADIRFSFSSPFQQRTGFSEFLLLHPIIATHYAKSLYLDAGQPFSASDYDLLQIMSDSSSLTSIEISSADWNVLLDRESSAFLSLIQIPTLQHLTLRSVDNFPAAALSLCCALTELALYGINYVAPPNTSSSTDDGMQSPLANVTTLELFHSTDRDKYNNTLATLMNSICRIAFDHLKEVLLEITTRAEFLNCTSS